MIQWLSHKRLRDNLYQKLTIHNPCAVGAEFGVRSQLRLVKNSIGQELELRRAFA
jgi:hypothetical protein